MGILNKLFGNEKQRSASFQVLANQLNLKYEPQNDFGLIKQLSHFGLFNHGRSKEI